MVQIAKGFFAIVAREGARIAVGARLEGNSENLLRYLREEAANGANSERIFCYCGVGGCLDSGWSSVGGK